MDTELTYLCDNKRHLICLPYSIENLHRMAEDLNIGKHFFEGDHYDIPARRIEEITRKCKLVNFREIAQIARKDNPQPKKRKRKKI